jgi:hypothetical protein
MCADSATHYNYDEFVPDKFNPWMRFNESPTIGSQGPDFPLWTLDQEETRLHEILASHRLTIIEFGSFT